MCSAAGSLSGLDAARAAARARSLPRGPVMRLPQRARGMLGIFTFLYDHSLSPIRCFPGNVPFSDRPKLKQTGLYTVFFCHRARRAGGVIVHIMFFSPLSSHFLARTGNCRAGRNSRPAIRACRREPGLCRRCRQARNGSRSPCTFPARSVRAGSNVRGGSPPPASRSSRPGRRRRAGRSGAPGCGRW